MKRMIVMAIGMVISASALVAQGKYLTNDGYISFYSHTVIEDITAVNKKVSAVIDGENGEIAVIVRMTQFQFEKKLMQEHFNENYVESDKFPKAIFNGRIVDPGKVDFSTLGKYQVQVSGEMKIHGVAEQVSSEGSIEVTDSGIIATTTFMLNPEDYDIKIPKVVRKNIAEQMEITVKLKCQPV